MSGPEEAQRVAEAFMIEHCRTIQVGRGLLWGCDARMLLGCVGRRWVCLVRLLDASAAGSQEGFCLRLLSWSLWVYVVSVSEYGLTAAVCMPVFLRQREAGNTMDLLVALPADVAVSLLKEFVASV